MVLPEIPSSPRTSIVIRTYNEAKHLPGVLTRIAKQTERNFEVIVVDSGSTDNTVEIAEIAGARIVHIAKSNFTFGRSLNIGCAAAHGEFLVFLSGHCYPKHRRWLDELLAPFDEPGVALVYGKQRGGHTTKFSEHCHFAKTFPNESHVPQDGFFCNNANSAVRRDLWRENHFDEVLTGLEDLAWAKSMTERGHKVAYTPRGGVIHLHDETWPQVFRRYEREAIALKQILPDFGFSFLDFVRLFCESGLLDLRKSVRQGTVLSHLQEIVAFRAMQYWGTYRGANYQKILTRQIKEKFFYPRK